MSNEEKIRSKGSSRSWSVLEFSKGEIDPKNGLKIQEVDIRKNSKRGLHNLSQ
jgi:hypothetical protein